MLYNILRQFGKPLTVPGFSSESCNKKRSVAMSSILENMRKIDLEKAANDLQFGNPPFKKDESKIYFGNSLAMSDISKKYIEKWKAADSGTAAAKEGTSILKALRQRNMDAATKNM